ncbi:hypothetical protein FB567DRAFT_615576 [Paraphoma chrysanthemicola]|uniref:Uncharacterized protein n=1 Tax=Paraphoma chrysanthemicola TaxID=798071 RepID=A0A8K0QS63_9PLEO|nr:hypothetical protein FB567DRAFT_615576 [Paraphoma chrysanthemicola]
MDLSCPTINLGTIYYWCANYTGPLALATLSSSMFPHKVSGREPWHSALWDAQATQDLLFAYIKAREVFTNLDRRPGQGDHDELGDEVIPYPSQAHDNPFAVVQPPVDAGSFRHLSADPDNLQPVRKKKVQVQEPANDDELKAMVTPIKNRLLTAMLRQEVRGVTIGDLLSQKNLREHLAKLLTDNGSHVVDAAEVNMATLGFGASYKS